MTGKKKFNDFIAMTKGQMGYSPSVREIEEAVGLRSPSSAHISGVMV